MASPRPVKILQISQSILDSVGLIDDPTDLWFGYPNKWRVKLEVTAMIHSNPNTPTPFQFDGLDVVAGDWLATSSGGVAVRIVSIDSATPTEVIAIVEDSDNFNITIDRNFSGVGIGPDGLGYLFEINESGIPILGPIAAFSVDITFQTDLQARFAKRNVIVKYVNVTQEDNGFIVGDIIAIDPANVGKFVKAVDPVLAVGVVTAIQLPTLASFSFKPFGEIIDDIKPDLIGNYGDIFFMDVNNPGGLTKIRPLANARPIYLRLENPNRGVLFASGTSGGSLSGGGDETETLLVTPTQDQVEFEIPGAFEILLMSINGIENNNFTFDNVLKVLTFDPVATGYGVDSSDEVIFIYKT